MTSPSDSEKDIITIDGMDVTAGFRWSVGELMDEFFSALSEKKILGSECPGCGYTYVPPRRRCGKCHSEIGEEDLIELPDKGILESFTITQLQLDGRGNFQELEEPKVIGCIKIEKADSKIFMPIGDISQNDVKKGMKVEASWRKETKGEIDDIQFFKTQEE